MRSRSLAVVATSLAFGMIVALAGCTGTAEQQAAAKIATDTDAATHDENARVPKGASWTQHYFPSADDSDTELHADVLLPEGLADGERVPVIMSIGPYFGHAGALGPEDQPHSGPSDRFFDLAEGGRLFERGYALVQVDLRGFGGSRGCPDLAGPGEQADVAAAVDWAAKQPWSTGSIGLYGKSYDASTALIGNNLKADPVKAVVAQEPLWDMVRNFRSDGVPRTTTATVANTYITAATMPQLPDAGKRYTDNAGYEVANPACLVGYEAGYRTTDPKFWQARDFAAQAKGSDTPLLITQGFTEWNTEPEAMQEFLENHNGPQRGWLGPWDHVRGNDKAPSGDLAMGRAGWFEEVMSFYDEELKGIEPPTAYPNYVVQDNRGTWRAQDDWPVVDRATTISLASGSYVDDGRALAPTDPADILTWSEPLARATRLTGTPRLSLKARGRGAVMIRLYDVAPDGAAVTINEQVSTVKDGTVAFDLKAQDWTLADGHRLAIGVGTVQPAGDWIATPSRERISVTDAELRLAVADPAEDVKTEGGRAAWIDGYLATHTTKLRAAPGRFTISAG